MLTIVPVAGRFCSVSGEIHASRLHAVNQVVVHELVVRHTHNVHVDAEKLSAKLFG